MATAPAVTQAGETWSGTATAGAIPEQLRKAGIDEATKLTYLTRKWNTFTWMLHNNFKSSKKIANDRKYIAREISEADRFYTVTVASADTNRHQVFSISNKQAAEIQPNDMLYILGLYAHATGTGMVAGQVYPAVAGVQGTNIGPDLGWSTGMNPTGVTFSRTPGLNQITGQYMTDYEQVKVLSKGAKDSGGTGNTQITVDRCYMGPHAYDEGGRILSRDLIYGDGKAIHLNVTHGDAAAAIQVGDILLRGAPAFKDGTNYPDGFFKNPVSDNNFTQLFKYAVAKTDESDIPATWVKERPFDINKWITTIRMNRDREYANLLGRKGMERDADGNETYLMGGVREFIPKDKDHYIVYNKADLRWNALLDLSKPLLELCNSGEMWAVTGVTMDLALTKSFYNEHLWYNKEESKSFDMSVKTLNLGGVKLNLIVSQVFEEAGFGNELMCLDMAEGDSFEPITNSGWDMKVDKDIAERGANIYKEGIQGMFGLQRRRKEHHCIIKFPQITL